MFSPINRYAPEPQRTPTISRRQFLRAAAVLGVSPLFLRSIDLQAAVSAASVPDGPCKGMTYYSTGSSDWQTQKMRDTIDRLVSDGVQWLSLVDYYWQDSLTSTSIYFDPAHSHTEADIAYVINYAHSKGMKVMLKPHIDLKTSGQYRWQIGTSSSSYDSTDWTNWFNSYKSFIERNARIAQTYGAEMFCVGTELDGTDSRTSDWQGVIDSVRSLYSGPITYACNTGRLQSIAWWDRVDIIGVDAYFVLTSTNSPTQQQLIDAWGPHKSTCASVSAKFGGKKVLFTECGYTNSDGCNKTPWATGGTRDDEEQRMCYEALFQACWSEPWFTGTFWWAIAPWENYPISGVGWNILGLPAEQTMKAWYGSASPSPTSVPVATATATAPAPAPTAPPVNDAYALMLSLSSNRLNPTPLTGQTVSGNIYVFVSPESGPSQVRFFLDDPSGSGAPISTENIPPWDLAGTNVDVANAYDTAQLSNGSHSITALISLSAGGTTTTTANFIVSNGGSATATSSPTATPTPRPRKKR